MGCGGIDLLKNYNIDLFSLILKKIKRFMIIYNPFYEISYNDFMKYLNSINEKDLNNKIEKICKNYNFNEFSSSLYKDVLYMANKKFQNIFPENYDYSNDIIMIVYLFTTRNIESLFKEKKELLEKIILKVSKNSNNEILTGKFYIIVLNIISFLLFSFISLFISIPILSLYYNLNKEDLYDLLVLKKNITKIKCEDINILIKEILQKISLDKINSNDIICHLLNNIFSPISDIIEKNPNVETINLSDKEIESVILNIEKIFNLNTFYDIFAYNYYN
jgi:hypothetical protein